MEATREGHEELCRKTYGRTMISKLGELTCSPDELKYINLRFSLRTTIYWWAKSIEDPILEELWANEEPLLENNIEANRHLLMLSDQNIHQAIKQQLEDWPLSEFSLNRLISKALHKSRELVESEANYVLELSIEYFTERHYTVPRSYMLNSFPSESSGMVPAAADSLIKSLKSIDITDDETANDESCSICLEEFCGSGCEVACMPCSHAFHGECIEKWLRTSHYCPLCRYEVSTDLIR